MTMKTAISIGLFVALTSPTAVTLAEDEVRTQAQTHDMVERAYIYARQEGRHQSFGETGNDGQQDQNRHQHRYGADNDRGQGTRTRQRSRDGSGSGSQHRYGADNDSGQGTRTRQRSRDGSGSGNQHRYGRSSGGSQHGAGNGGRRH